MDLSARTRIFLMVVFVLFAGFIVIAVIFVLKSHDRKKGKVKLIQWFNNNQPLLLVCFMVFFILCVINSTIHYSNKFLPQSASTPQSEIAPLFDATTVLTSIAFFLTQILLFYFAFRFRAAPSRKASYIKSALKLEAVWTLVPTLTFLLLFLWGQVLWAKIVKPPPGDVLIVEVVGEQFNWRVRYPGPDGRLGKADFRFISNENSMGIDTSDVHSKDDFMPLQMHLPKGRPVKILLRSKDVIHSFFIPYFKVKMDAVPGMITRTYFTPRTSTAEMRKRSDNPYFDYEVACAELCGRLHFGMKLILKVDEPEEFRLWLDLQEKTVPGNLASEERKHE